MPTHQSQTTDQDRSFESELKRYGICPDYIDAWGKPQRVADNDLEAILSAVKASQTKTKHTAPRIAPAYVWHIHQEKNLSITRQIPWDDTAIVNSYWQLCDEFGNLFQGSLSDVACAHQDKDSSHLLNCSLAYVLSPGYYDLNFFLSGEDEPLTTRVIIAPDKCYQLDSKKVWGPNIQLYTLRSQNNWGVGDFADLKVLVKELAERGASYVGLNPLHALFPHQAENASPYSPSSRYWLNMIYLDIPSVDGFSLSAKVQDWVKSAEFTDKLMTLRQSDSVNYPEVTALKLEVLKLIFDSVYQLDPHHALIKSFSQFKAHYGQNLARFACYEAIRDPDATHPKSVNSQHLDSAYPTPEHPNVAEFINLNPKLIDFYCFIQWQTHKQLESVQLTARKYGMSIGLFRDLAVGVNGDSADVWALSDLFCPQASIGAPPDVLNYQGQSWGLPPIKPNVLAESGYQEYIDLLRANLRSCGALRIDHILGLLRLWWVPNGRQATQGAYVHYPVDELIAILALESHRHQCVIIGEDLGTIPESIKAKQHQTGILSYKVFFFQTAPDGGYYSPADYPSQALATLCTHDMPTIRGYWHCEDLKLSKSLGLLGKNQDLDHLYHERLEAKQRVLDSVAWHGFLPQDVSHDAHFAEMTPKLNQALHLHMAQTESQLLSVQIEDWLNMDTAVNVPGTSTEYPNWRRKLSHTLEAMFMNPKLNHFLARLNQIRQDKNHS